MVPHGLLSAPLTSWSQGANGLQSSFHRSLFVLPGEGLPVPVGSVGKVGALRLERSPSWSQKSGSCFLRPLFPLPAFRLSWIPDGLLKTGSVSQKDISCFGFKSDPFL